MQSIFVFSVWVIWEKFTGGNFPPSNFIDMGSAGFFCAATIVMVNIKAMAKTIKTIENAFLAMGTPPEIYDMLL